MYLSGPGWIGFTVFGLIRQGPMDAELGLLLLVLSLTMNFAPKLATLADVLLRRRLREAFGGAPAVLLSALAETVFTMLIVPICALSVTLFVLGLPLGRQVGWTAQQRDAEGGHLSTCLCLSLIDRSAVDLNRWGPGAVVDGVARYPYEEHAGEGDRNNERKVGEGSLVGGLVSSGDSGAETCDRVHAR
ncbi:MAG: glucans biosynthesis glucosyltransferase MdoH, partial [Chloroflexota bacterium]